MEGPGRAHRVRGPSSSSGHTAQWLHVGHVQFVHVHASHVSLQFGQLHWVSLSMSTSPDRGIAI